MRRELNPSAGGEDRLRIAMEQQYARRSANAWTYSLMAPHYMPVRQEIERHLHACVTLVCERRGISRENWKAVLETLRVLDVGCGHGGWLSFLISLGFRPQNLRGVEILEERARGARQKLPAATRIAHENFLRYDEGDFDLILFSVVFSSILDPEQRMAVAQAALAKLRPGGAVIVFDFVYDNPRNPDVRRVTSGQMVRYFAGCSIAERSALLAPPIARLACRIHPWLYDLLNVPLLRSHRFWVVTPRARTEARLNPIALLLAGLAAMGASHSQGDHPTPGPAPPTSMVAVAGTPLFGTRHTPNNRPVADWEPSILERYGGSSTVDALATADLHAGIGRRWGSPYVVFRQNSYAIYYARDGDPEYVVADGSGEARNCPLDRGLGYAGVRVPPGARIFTEGRARVVTDGPVRVDDDVHFTIVDVARNRVYGFYANRGSWFGVTGSRFKTAWRGCDLLRGDDDAILAASAAARRYGCGGGGAYPLAACGLAGVGAGVSAGGTFGNGDSNGFLGPHGVIMPQDFDDTGWTGPAVGTLHHALRCSNPAAYQHGHVWPMQDPASGTRGRHLRSGQIIRLDPSFDVARSGAPAWEQRLMRTLQVYGCVLSDYADYGMALFALSSWPGTGPRRDDHDPWTAAGGANAEAQAFHAGLDSRGVRTRVLSHMPMRALQVVLPHGAAHPPRAR